MKKPRNKFETKLYKQLKKARVSFKYESERIPYHWVGHYIPDFILTLPTGKIYIEAKGYLRPEHKRKLIAVKKLNPSIDLRILFYADTKKNTKWAVKHGFVYAIGVIPVAWLNRHV